MSKEGTMDEREKPQEPSGPEPPEPVPPFDPDPRLIGYLERAPKPSIDKKIRTPGLVKRR